MTQDSPNLNIQNQPLTPQHVPATAAPAIAAAQSSQVAAESAPKRPSPKQQVYRMAFHGDGGSLAVLILKHILLKLVTFGFYSFWAKTAERKYIWGHISFFNHRLQFHGTAKELLFAWARLMVAIVGFVVIVNVMVRVGAQLLVPLVVYPVMLVLIPYAIVSQRRYIYSRTSWRGIRFGMAPVHKPFMIEFIKGILLSGITFGFYWPYMEHNLYRVLTNATSVGSLKLRYTGNPKDLFNMYLKWLIPIILTFGFASILFMFDLKKYQFNNTWIGSESLGAAKARFKATKSQFLGLAIVNVLLLGVTFGLALPWIAVRNIQFYIENVEFVGNVDFDGIAQKQQSGRAVGDQLADALDIGIGI